MNTITNSVSFGEVTSAINVVTPVYLVFELDYFNKKWHDGVISD